MFAAVVGLSIVAYWALPFDALARLGLPRFQGGIEVFFIAGAMMVLGAAWALVANAELLLKPLTALFTRLPGLQFMTRLASAYPLHHRFRTGLSIVMFSLVIFAMTVMAVITNAMQNNYTYHNFQIDPSTPEAETYYFKVAPGQDKRALALALGSAFLDNGLESTVLEDAIWSVRGPRILLSNVLLGVVGLTLLLGIAALAITGTRAVVERRQQIGMLRALGCRRRLIQGAFLSESFFVGCTGSVLGVILGLILSNNIFAVDFFEQFHTGLIFSVPWNELELIVGVALLASLLAALLPAWQAGRVTPSEALRV
ncbi:MAG: ABC transporter permease [Chloroflexi bacterium]|nr:MAG: ABC transporter permease [Chloroflexota bacterium]